jgi:hypothetical protein
LQAHEASEIVRSPAERREPAVSLAEAQAAELNQLEHAEAFRRRVALWVAFVALILAITAMARDQSSRAVINANIHASDTYNFYQAKNIRQTENQIAADQLQTVLALQDPPQPLRAELEQRLAGYRANVARYESEPDTGEGKRELLSLATAWEKKRDESGVSEHSFHYGEALLQIAIVLGSVSILALSRSVLWLSVGGTALATLLVLNGYVFGLHLPI